jgi:hypothetical protein
MRCADFLRCKEARRNAVTQSFQVAYDFLEAKPKMPSDVFKKDNWRFAFSDDAGDMRPQMPIVGCSFTFACDAEGLAWVARRNEIHAPTPWDSIEGFNLVPYRRFIQGLVFHPRHESGRCEGFPLNVTHSLIELSESEFEAKFQSSNPGT